MECKTSPRPAFTKFSRKTLIVGAVVRFNQMFRMNHRSPCRRIPFDGQVGGGSMEPRRRVKSRASQSRGSLLLMAILIAASFSVFSAPVVLADGARDASIMLSVNPTTQTVNPGESAEYTVTVRNLGADPVTINLQSSEEPTQECNAYTSTITQITGQIEGGASEEATLTVTLAQGATDECDTTVRATATEVGTPGAPDQQESTVTTKSGEGESGPLYGVDLKIDEPDLEWDGSEIMEWDVEVENTGRVNETVLLTIDENDNPGCDPSDLEIEVDPSTVSIDNESSEWVEVIVTVPTGSSAARYCWTLHGQVQNDPTQNASDDLDLELTVPGIHECSAGLSSSMINVDPENMEVVVTVTFSNTGNSQFTIATSISGAKSEWASVSGASSGLLPYDDGEGEKEFTILIDPDDSVGAGSEHALTIEGNDGSSKLCEVDLRVIVGQSHGAAMSLSTSTINQVEPGGNGSIEVTVMNLGNGPDTLKLSTSAPPVGWSVSLSSSTVNVGSRHGTSSQATVEVMVYAPYDALADDAISIEISVIPNNGGEAYASDEVTITVMPIHDWDVEETDIKNQTGRSGTMVNFPITLVNDGNIGDDFMFAVIFNTRSTWATHFMDGQTPVTSVVVPAFSEKTVNLAVSIDAEGVGEERDSATLTIRITNSATPCPPQPQDCDEDGDDIPDNQRESSFKATLSNRNHSMAITIDEAWSHGYGEPGAVQVILAPGGSVSVPVWIENTGDFTDEAYFLLSGLEGIGTRSLEYEGADLAQSGYQVEVDKAFAAWNYLSNDYEADSEDSLAFHEVKNKRCDVTCAENGVEQWISVNSDNNSHETRVYKIRATLIITVSDGAENGAGGSATISVSSTKNTVQKSTVNIPILVQSIKKISIDSNGVDELTVNYPDSATFSPTITNDGNTPTEIRVFTSEGLRGWVVSLEADLSGESNVVNGITMAANTCSVDEGNELTCILQPGTNITVRAIVKSPHGTAVGDDFVFTFSAEPVDLEIVGRVNQELEVHGMPQQGGLSFLGTTEGLAGISIGLILLISYIFIEPKRRARVASKAARPKYVAELEPLPVNQSGAKRFKTNRVEMVAKEVGAESVVTITSSTSDSVIGFANRSTKGKGKRDMWVFADASRTKPQLHCIHRSKKKRIFDVMDTNSNTPFCVLKNIGKKKWSILRVDGSPWLDVHRSGLGSSKTWSFSPLDGDDIYGTISVNYGDDGTTELSAERFTTDLDARALWLVALAILME